MIRTGTFVSIHALPVNQTVTSPSLSVDDDEDSEAHQSPSRFSARWLRLALSAQAHQVCAEKTRRWHSMLAGALSGGLVLFEKAAEKGGHRKQLFRPLRFTQRLYLKTWFPPTQWRSARILPLIVYASFSRPETLPRSYTTWCLLVDQQLRQAPQQVQLTWFETSTELGRLMQHMDRILKREDLVPANQAAILARKALATSSPPDFGPPYAPCAAVHPWIEPCMHVPLPRFFTVFKWAFQI
ncbi:hypothetical protein M405DRAFT_870070 [Rhizopogon salebrosus TDB-379]|nr:hypothetical protein M405DRAFT_870070 [Rhizopogon salebrosus TDB-379]